MSSSTVDFARTDPGLNIGSAERPDGVRDVLTLHTANTFGASREIAVTCRKGPTSSSLPDHAAVEARLTLIEVGDASREIVLP